MTHELGPLPDPEAWRTQVGPWGDRSTDYAYTLNQMRAYALAEVERAVKAERERCAQICEEIESEYQRRDGRKFPELRSDAQEGSATCAARIRKGDA